MVNNRFSYRSIILAVIMFLLAGCASSTKEGSLQARTAPNRDAENILVSVGNRDITVHEFRERFQAMASSRDKDIEGQKEKALDRMVLTSLLSLEAKAEKIDTEEAVASTLRIQADNILAREYYNREIRPKVSVVSEAEIKDYYYRHMDEYRIPLKVKARHILVGVKPNASPKEWAEAKEKSRNLKKEIDNGSDFSKLAREHSDDRRTKTKGGLLGGFSYSYLTRKNLPAGFPEEVFSLEQGEVSDPVRGARGYHIIKVEVKQPEQTRTLDQARSNIKRRLEKQKYDDLLARIIERLEKKYKVSVNTELLGAVQFEDDGKCKKCRDSVE